MITDLNRLATLLTALLLAGCAGPSTRLAPVESRTVDPGLPPVVSQPSAPVTASRPDGDVSVTALPAPEPVTGVPQPLPSGTTSTSAEPRPLPSAPEVTPQPATVPPLALVTPVTSTAAVDDILRDVRKRWAAGQHEQAAAGLERALRIEPANPYLWQHLAAVRLDQRRPQLAEQFAAKSNSVAGNSAPLRMRNWRIIAEARRQSGNAAGAREAESRAAQYEADR